MTRSAPERHPRPADAAPHPGTATPASSAADPRRTPVVRAPRRRGGLTAGSRPVVAEAKLSKGTGPHALRHAYASSLIAAGESVKVVSERLGHANAVMILNVYSHLFPESERQARAAVDQAFGALRGECAPDVPSQPER
ncbi:tyrosine-type recombinase/integrase [Streptomyces sp. NPDC055025]